MFWTGGRSPKKTIISYDQLPSWFNDKKQDVYPDDGLEEQTDQCQYSINPEINQKISFWMAGNSSLLSVDAIVNEANEDLNNPGVGLCDMIFQGAGNKLVAECNAIGHCDIGQVVVTPGFDLPAHYIIHAVGPVGEHLTDLYNCYKSILQKIDGFNIRTIGLCCLSTGIYGCPSTSAAWVALKSVREYLDRSRNHDKVDRIVFVIPDSQNIRAYEQLIPHFFPRQEIMLPDSDDSELPAIFAKILGSAPTLNPILSKRLNGSPLCEIGSQ